MRSGRSQPDGGGEVTAHVRDGLDDLGGDPGLDGPARRGLHRHRTRRYSPTTAKNTWPSYLSSQSPDQSLSPNLLDTRALASESSASSCPRNVGTYRGAPCMRGRFLSRPRARRRSRCSCLRDERRGRAQGNGMTSRASPCDHVRWIGARRGARVSPKCVRETAGATLQWREPLWPTAAHRCSNGKRPSSRYTCMGSPNLDNADAEDAQRLDVDEAYRALIRGGILSRRGGVENATAQRELALAPRLGNHEIGRVP